MDLLSHPAATPIGVSLGSLVVMVAGYRMSQPRIVGERRLPDLVSEEWALEALAPPDEGDRGIIVEEVERHWPETGASEFRQQLMLLNIWPDQAPAFVVYCLLYIGYACGVLAWFEVPVGTTPGLRMLGALLGGLLGIAAAWFLMRRQMAIRLRSMDAALAAAMDLLTGALEGGLTFEQALSFTGLSFQTVEPYLAKNLRLASHQFSNGVDRREIFDGLYERTSLEGMKSLGATATQLDSGSLITNMGPTIRRLSEQMRIMRFAHAEERAQQVPLKLNVIMIVFFLPPLFAFLMSPALIKAFETVDL